MPISPAVFFYEYCHVMLTGGHEMNTTLQQRCTRFLEALGLPVTAFGRLVGLSSSSIHKWRSGLLKLSDVTERKIDQLLHKYGF